MTTGNADALTGAGRSHRDAQRRTTRRREETMCDNCPFAASGPGARLARSLRPGRMRDIKLSVLGGATFHCHKTTRDDGWDDDGDGYTPVGTERVCGGSLAWLRRMGAR